VQGSFSFRPRDAVSAVSVQVRSPAEFEVDDDAANRLEELVHGAIARSRFDLAHFVRQGKRLFVFWIPTSKSAAHSHARRRAWHSSWDCVTDNGVTFAAGGFCSVRILE
jgi:hypothetical protein